MNFHNWLNFKAAHYNDLAIEVAKDDYPMLARSIDSREIDCDDYKVPYSLFKDLFSENETDRLVFYLHRFREKDRWLLFGFDKSDTPAYPEFKRIFFGQFCRLLDKE